MLRKIFWLHIKKSGGMSTRAALGDLYTQVDRSRMPSGFTGRPREEWNDILNNYRIPLGAYQFRRSDFAKDVLYRDDWSGMLSIAFCREPADRTLSMFFYLFSPARRREPVMRKALAQLAPQPRRLCWTESYAFCVFLDLLALQAKLRSQTISEPVDLHFATHTNPMSLDVGFCGERTQLSHIYKLENHEKGIDLCYDAAGLARPEESRHVRRHATKRSEFVMSDAQRRKIRELFAEDFALYDKAL